MKRLTLLFTIILPLLIIMALLNTVTLAVRADDVGGIIDTNTTWTVAGSPYIITDTVIITAGVTLTVEAGVEVQAQPGTGLEVNGTLLAFGTPTQPITLTSTTETGPGDWEGISVESTGDISLNHTLVRYGMAGLNIQGTSNNLVQINNSTLNQNQTGISIDENALHRLQMKNLFFSDNTSNRVFINHTDASRIIENTLLTPQPGLDGYEFDYDTLVLFVPEGITLTLEAGVTLFMHSRTILSINGHLQANGVSGSEVIFTSASDSGPGQWDVLSVGTTGSAYLEHAIVRYAILGIYISGYSNKQVTLVNTLLVENDWHGLAAGIEAIHRLRMNNVTFYQNGYGEGSERIHIRSSGNSHTFRDNTTLVLQPGLEGYEIGDSSAIVPKGITLTLEAGTKLMMSRFSGLTIEGNLRAMGTNGARVNFTSLGDIILDNWEGITVGNGGAVHLEHTDVRYGTANLTVNGLTSTVTITASRLVSASVDGIVVNEGTVNVACSLVAGNSHSGIFVTASDNPTVTINSSEISGNGAGITNTHNLPVDARTNFWGNPSGPSGQGPGSGDTVYGNVLYEPWLAKPICSPSSPSWQLYLPAVLKQP